MNQPDAEEIQYFLVYGLFHGRLQRYLCTHKKPGGVAQLVRAQDS